MTCLYNTYFVTIWLTNVLAIPMALTMIVWGIGWYWVPERLAIGLSLAVAGLVWIIYLRLHGPRVLMRAGAWPASSKKLDASQEMKDRPFRDISSPNRM